MAQGDMKAVLTLTADASGVSVGISRAMRDLERLQRGVADLRGLAVAGMASNLFRGLASGAMEELNRLGELGRTWSPEGMKAAGDLALVRQQSDMALGQAFGASTALVDRMEAQHVVEMTEALRENSRSIADAQEALQVLKMTWENAKTDALVKFGDFYRMVSEAIDHPGPVLEAMPGASAVAGGQGNAMILVEIYDLIRQKLGGK